MRLSWYGGLMLRSVCVGASVGRGGIIVFLRPLFGLDPGIPVIYSTNGQMEHLCSDREKKERRD